MQSSARQRLRSASISSLFRCTRLSTIGSRAFLVAAAWLWNTAAERHVGIVNICFQETFEDPSLQSFFPECPVVPVQWLCHFRHCSRSYLLTYLFTYLLIGTSQSVVQLSRWEGNSWLWKASIYCQKHVSFISLLVNAELWNPLEEISISVSSITKCLRQ